MTTISHDRPEKASTATATQARTGPDRPVPIDEQHRSQLNAFLNRSPGQGATLVVDDILRAAIDAEARLDAGYVPADIRRGTIAYGCPHHDRWGDRYPRPGHAYVIVRRSGRGTWSLQEVYPTFVRPKPTVYVHLPVAEMTWSAAVLEHNQLWLGSGWTPPRRDATHANGGNPR